MYIKKFYESQLNTDIENILNLAKDEGLIVRVEKLPVHGSPEVKNIIRIYRGNNSSGFEGIGARMDNPNVNGLVWIMKPKPFVEIMKDAISTRTKILNGLACYL